ncbi:lef-7 protein [Thysanoplusia orichalcea nucleopolyhedrovirus]|uniref:Lef-7 protein n=1 Tax=Thysanoplusia orichalcea nucleopolyhedrovirus TaxID=101850 RepID=L0CJW0_9ABAC|nr:lef-7 protein [Thysanoplusia orichalcea nucleopolyhedrovirus]AGA16274.1 lef-7 protein [Thysanoplusia orichalcea nucleopolyhedrovirus]
MLYTAKRSQRLPLEIVETILSYSNTTLHAKIVGFTAIVKRRLLQEDNIVDYFKLTPINYNPSTDQMILNYLGVANQPIAPYLTSLCSFKRKGRLFFNRCIPENVRIATLNWPLPSLETFLCKQFLWYNLVRKLIIHEKLMNRGVTASMVQIKIDNGDDDNEEMLIYFNECIIDCDINDVHRCPELQADVYFDNHTISLYSYLKSTIYRIK